MADSSQIKRDTAATEMGVDFSNATDLVQDKLSGWLETLILMLPNIAVAFLVLLAFYVVARLLRFSLTKFTLRFSKNVAISRLISSIIFALVIISGAFVALSVLNLDKTVTSLLAGAGIIGLAIGLAFQDTIGNFISGIMIAVRKPYRVNDIIETQGHQGTVKSINLRATVLRSFQGQDVIIPNKKIYDEPIVNYTCTGERRVDLTIGVSYGDDLEKVEKVTIDALKGKDFIKPGTDITLYFKEFAESSINFDVRFWINYPDNPGFLTGRSKAIKEIKKAFDQNNITIPFPIRTLDFGIKGGTPISEMTLPIKEISTNGKKEHKLT